MLIHSVYFWLKPELKPEEIQQYVNGAKSLLKISSVRHGWVAKPAIYDRPVIDRSYSFALILVFENTDGHDAYQVDPIHDQFRIGCAHLWNQVKIYDSEE
jgi:hypothetical protein